MKIGYLTLALLFAGAAGADTLSVNIIASQPEIDTWAYTLSNHEPAHSPNYLFAFLLPINASVEAIAIPPGWDAQTDGSTFIYWFSVDYAADVAPGDSTSGFVVSAHAISGLSESATYSWDHVLDGPGPSSYDVIESPMAELSPEPSAVMLFLCGVTLIGAKCKVGLRWPKFTKPKAGPPY